MKTTKDHAQIFELRISLFAAIPLNYRELFGNLGHKLGTYVISILHTTKKDYY